MTLTLWQIEYWVGRESGEACAKWTSAVVDRSWVAHGGMLPTGPSSSCMQYILVTSTEYGAQLTLPQRRRALWFWAGPQP